MRSMERGGDPDEAPDADAYAIKHASDRLNGRGDW